MDLTAFVNAYRGPLIGLIVSWGAPWADAAEIAQDSFSEAWISRDACLGDWNDPDFLSRWLRGVAWNLYRNWARSRRRGLFRMVTVAPAELAYMAAGESEKNERIEALRGAILRLPARQREVVLMHYLEETSIKGVAVLLSVTVKTVEGRLFQARRNLRRLMGEEFPAAEVARMLLCL